MGAAAQGHKVRLPGGLQLHYQDVGSGEAVVFIHGSGPGASGHSNFKHNYPVFAEAGYRAIVPDLPGYGASDKPETAIPWISSSRLCWACSMPGYPALHAGWQLPGWGHRHRHRPASAATGGALVLMAPGGLMDKAQYYLQMEGIQRMATAFASGELRDAAGMKRLLGLQLFDPSLIDDETVAERVAVVAQQPPCVLSTMEVPNMAERLPELACPILGFWGMDDKFCPVSGANTLMQACRHVRFVLLSECGHWVMVEHRDLFNRDCLAFLEEGRP